MPSPFTQYTGEQVPQINILPYTQGIANSIQQGISDLGKGIGEAIKGYRENQQRRDEKSAFLAQAISEYTYDEIDQGDDSQENYEGPRPTGNVLIKPTAPSHLVKIFNKANTGEGDWAGNLANLSSKEIDDAFQNHQAYLYYDKQKFDRKIAQSDADASSRLKNAQASNLEIETILNKRKLDQLAYQEEVLKEGNKIALEDPYVTHTVNTTEKVPTGTVYNTQTGEVMEDVSFDNLASSMGIKREDILTEDQWNAMKKTLSASDDITASKILSETSSFDPNISFGNQPSDRIKFPDGTTETSAMRFIKNVYQNGLALTKNDSEKKAFEQAFLGVQKDGKFTGSNYKDIDSNPNREYMFNLAKKFAGSKQMVDRLRNSKTIDGKPLFPQFTSTKDIPNRWVIKSGSQKDYSVPVTKSTTLKMSNLDIYRTAIEKVNSVYASQGKAPPLSMSLALNAVGFSTLGTTVYDPLSGATGVYVGDASKGTGMIVPESAVKDFITKGANLGSGNAETSAQMNKQSVANFLKLNYSTPVDIGHGKSIVYRKTINEFAGGIHEKSTDDMQSAVTAVQRINKIADKMTEMTKNSNLFEKMLPEWNREYASLNLNAQTMRSWFIAKGQETDKDNERLQDILAWQDAYLKTNPKLALKLIENFRSIVEDSVLSNLQGKGFEVVGGKAGSPVAYKDFIDRLESEARKNGYSPKKS